MLAEAKVMKGLGLLPEYRWSFNMTDLALSLTNIGPAVIGIPWYYSMYEAPGGVIRVGGDLAGGHCILVTRYRKQGIIFPDEPAFGVFNSWGPEWGIGGHAWVRQSDLGNLLRADGEACVPYRRSYGR